VESAGGLPIFAHGFRRWTGEGVAAAAIERTRVCDHRKGVKIPSWRRRRVDERVAEGRGVLAIGTARGKSASGRENRSARPGEAVCCVDGGGRGAKDNQPVARRGGEGRSGGVSRSVPRDARACARVYSSRRRRQSARRPAVLTPPTHRRRVPTTVVATTTTMTTTATTATTATVTLTSTNARNATTVYRACLSLQTIVLSMMLYMTRYVYALLSRSPRFGPFRSQPSNVSFSMRLRSFINMSHVCTTRCSCL